MPSFTVKLAHKNWVVQSMMTVSIVRLLAMYAGLIQTVQDALKKPADH